MVAVAKGRRTALGTTLLLVLLTFVPWVHSAVRAESTALRINTHELAYANLYRPIEFPDGHTLTLEYRILGLDDINGRSWGPAVFLTWDPHTFLGLRLNSSDRITLRLDILGNRHNDHARVYYPSSRWVEMKLVLTPARMEYFIRESGTEEWIEVDWLSGSRYRDGTRPTELSAQPAGIVIGTGRGGAGHPELYLRNSYPDLSSEEGKRASVLITDIVLRVDGDLVFEERFDTDLGTLYEVYDIEADGYNEDPVFELVRVSIP